MAATIDTEPVCSVDLVVESADGDEMLIPMTLEHGRKRDSDGVIVDACVWSLADFRGKGHAATVPITAGSAPRVLAVRVTYEHVITDDEGNHETVETTFDVGVLRRTDSWNQSGPQQSDYRTLPGFIGVGTGQRRTLKFCPTIEPHRKNGNYVFAMRLVIDRLEASQTGALSF